MQLGTSYGGDARPRRSGRPRPRILLLFGLVAIGLVAGILLIVTTIRMERAERRQLLHTTESMDILRDLNRASVNAETGQRGYFITLDRRYLAPYSAASRQFGPLLDRLEQHIDPDATAAERRLLDEVDQLTRARFAELEETVELMRSRDLDGARRRILTDEGQDVMERLRRAITQLEAVQRDKLRRAQAISHASERLVVPMLLVQLAMIVVGLALGLWQVIRNADAEARAAAAGELAQARDRADLLAGELNHRVKNLFAVILAIVQMSARDLPEAREAIDRIAERIRALFRAHEITQSAEGSRDADVRDLVTTVVAPYRTEGTECTLDGPDLTLPAQQVVPFGLILHELTTNAVKYGAWRSLGGRIAIRWSLDGKRLILDWREELPHSAPAEPQGRGFGSVLLEGSARQLQGTVERRKDPAGVSVRLEFPLRN
jgi:two-component sensor histidine kinase/CHASE3 domain sensor protein